MTKLYCLLIKIMPKKLQYLTAMSVIAYATSGKYSSTIVPELSAMDTVRRFERDHKIK